MNTVPLAVVALTLAIAYGIWYSYSVILVALLAEFGWSRGVLAGAFGVFTLVHGGMNPVIGMLCARFRSMRVLATGGGALGVQLGGPMPGLDGEPEPRPDVGMGDAVEAEVLPSAVGLVWRALIVWLLLVFLLSLANWTA